MWLGVQDACFGPQQGGFGHPLPVGAPANERSPRQSLFFNISSDWLTSHCGQGDLASGQKFRLRKGGSLCLDGSGSDKGGKQSGQCEVGFSPLMAVAMELSAHYLREKLQRDLEAEHVEVEDTTPNRCATSFRVLVVSTKFEGKPLLQRHRLVNECLSQELPHIHAFEQKTLTPGQWAREQSK